MSTRPGAWVARARLAATLGSPIPTKQVMPSRSARAAQVVIISSAVKPGAPLMPARPPGRPRPSAPGRGPRSPAGAGGERADDLLHGDDRAPRGEHRLLLDAGDPPELDVARPVGPLGVDHRDVGPQRGHRGQLLAGEGAGDVPDRG